MSSSSAHLRPTTSFASSATVASPTPSPRRATSSPRVQRRKSSSAIRRITMAIAATSSGQVTSSPHDMSCLMKTCSPSTSPPQLAMCRSWRTVTLHHLLVPHRVPPKLCCDPGLHHRRRPLRCIIPHHFDGLRLDVLRRNVRQPSTMQHHRHRLLPIRWSPALQHQPRSAVQQHHLRRPSPCRLRTTLRRPVTR